MKTYLLKKTNKIISVTLVLIGILYLYLGRNLRFGSWASPKTGFMPRVAGVAMVFLSVINAIVELRKEDEIPEELRALAEEKKILIAEADMDIIPIPVPLSAVIKDILRR